MATKTKLAWLSLLASVVAGCGGGSPPDTGTTSSVSTTTSSSSSGSSSSIDLTTTATTTTIDSGLPAAVAQAVVQVISVADAQPVGKSLLIPTNSAGFATPVFAVDVNQNVLVAAYANSATTTLGADSTAMVLVLETVGVIPSPGPTFSQLVQDVQSAADYSALVASIATSLSSGTPPLQSSSVVDGVATVVDQIVKQVAAQSSPNATVGSRARKIAAQVALEQAFPGPPVQIVGLSSNLPTILSVYISNLTSSGVNLINTQPLTWDVTSTDQTGATLSPAQTLAGTNAILDLIPGLTPEPLAVAGNGRNFTVTVAQTSATEQTNLAEVFSDLLSLAISRAAGIEPSGNVSKCSADAATEMLKGLGDGFQEALLTSPTEPQAAAVFAAHITSTVLYQPIRAALGCALPGSAAAQALANLAGWLVPEVGIWKSISVGFGAVAPVTDLTFFLAYLNASQPIEVCESGGALVSCLVGTWTYSGVTTSGAATTAATTTYTFNSDGSEAYSASTNTTYSDGTPSGSTSCTASGTYVFSGVTILTITQTAFSELCGSTVPPFVTDYTIVPSPPPSVLTFSSDPGQNFIEQ